MSLAFPASPSVGDTYTVGARTWTWSGTIWEITGTVAAAGSIGTTELASSAVTAAKIADSTITSTKLASTVPVVTVCTSSTRPGSPFTGQTIFETDTNKMKVWLGSAWSGGTQHVDIPSSIDILVVAGGGGGGNRSNGGRGSPGGAGGLIYIESFPVLSGTYTVTVAGATALDTQGSNSVFTGNSRTLTALGGGHGRNADSQGAAPAGGSSGGSWFPGYASNAPTQASTTSDGISTYTNSGFGNAGGTSGGSSPYGAGGGGAGGAGANFNTAGGPVGGIGKEYSISGTATYYAGGGGGADWAGNSCTRYAGGLGGGGRGDNCADNSDKNGTANTGGGGGANGTGGSGVVILRYLAGPTGVTGGTKTTSGSYTIHTFTSSGSLVIA